MIDLKPYGAFVENTIRPILDQSRWLIEELNRVGFPVNEENIHILINTLLDFHFKTLLVNTLKTITVTCIICFTFWITKGGPF